MAKNYTDNDGDRTIIGGTLEFREGAKVVGLRIPTASTTKHGIIKQAKSQKFSTAKDVEGLVKDFNQLLEKLKIAGIMSK